MATGCYGNDVQVHDVQLALWQKIQTVQLDITLIFGRTGTYLMQQRGSDIFECTTGYPIDLNSNCDTFLYYNHIVLESDYTDQDVLCTNEGQGLFLNKKKSLKCSKCHKITNICRTFTCITEPMDEPASR